MAPEEPEGYAGEGCGERSRSLSEVKCPMGIVGDEARRELIVALDKLRGDSGNVCGDGDSLLDWDQNRLKLLF